MKTIEELQLTKEEEAEMLAALKEAAPDNIYQQAIALFVIKLTALLGLEEKELEQIGDAYVAERNSQPGPSAISDALLGNVINVLKQKENAIFFILGNLEQRLGAIEKKYEITNSK